MKFCLSDNYTKSNLSTSYYPDYYKPHNDNGLKKLNLRANTKYEHLFKDKSKLVLEVNYNYLPQKNNLETNDYLAFDSDSKKNNIGGNMEYSLNVYQNDAKRNSIKLLAGADYNLLDQNRTTSQSNILIPTSSDFHSSTYFVSPYLRFDCQFGKLFVKSILEYQLYNYTIRSNQNTSSEQTNETHTFHNNLTGKLAVGWQFNPHNYIRLVYDKKLKRPLDEQIFPYFIYSSSLNAYTVGNSDLNPMTSNEIKLEYISDISTKNNTSMILNASVNYIRTDDIVQSIENPTIPYNYLTFSNNGNSDILCSGLMFYLRKNVFSFCATGNLYFDKSYNNGNKDYSTYYSLSFQSALNFKSGWMGIVNFIYYSSVNSATRSLGDIPYCKLSVGKVWKHVQIHGFCTADLSGRVTDIIYNSQSTQYNTYYTSAPVFGLSVKVNL